MSKRPSVFGTMGLPKPTAPVETPDASRVEKTTKPSQGEEMFRTSLYIPLSVQYQLEEIRLHEKKRKVHDLYIEGINEVLKKRGYPPIQESKK